MDTVDIILFSRYIQTCSDLCGLTFSPVIPMKWVLHVISAKYNSFIFVKAVFMINIHYYISCSLVKGHLLSRFVQ